MEALPSPPPPVEAWLLRGKLQVAAAACAGGRLAGRCAGLVSGGAAPQHLQLVLLQPRGFPCTRPSLLHPWLAGLTTAGGMQVAQALMPSDDEDEASPGLAHGLPVRSSKSWSESVQHSKVKHSGLTMHAGNWRWRYILLKALHTGGQLCLWPVLLHPLVGLCESPSPLLHEVCYHHSWRSAADLIAHITTITRHPLCIR